MNFARIALAAVAAWVVSIPMGYVVNEIILKDLYLANAATMRPEAEIFANLPIGFGFMLVGFFAFAYAYAKGYEGGQGLMEGVRYGVLVGLMIDCFAIVWSGLTTHMSMSLTTAMMIDYIFEFALYGGIVGAVYRPSPAAASRVAI